MVRIIKISHEEAKRRLEDVPDGKRFWCHDGKVIRNLKELSKALNDMSDETFHYHLSGARNDFSKWIREVVGDDKLAEDFSKTKSRTQASQVVATSISFLQRKM
ncbi:MAG: hypothetical protein A2Z77_01485 [Chloroflexi bacterium RBG_13_51_36]|nr:MAG: hypothetical protein A2Z77_01485 [Chloroflexi bacterium RBG_13_51_36]